MIRPSSCLGWVPRRTLALLPPLLAVASAGGWPGPARAQDTLSTRSLGMGSALRGAATGSTALLLNPSGMSLSKSYIVEGAYRFAQKAKEHGAHVAIADSTSAFNIAGGLHYTYFTAEPTESVRHSRHEGGAALSFPVGDRFFIGGNLRYLRAEAELGAPGAATTTTTTGLTFDAGITVRPVEMLSIGVVGYGLRDLEDAQAPFAVGGGLALVPNVDLVVAVDGFYDFQTWDPNADGALSISGGAEYTFAGRLATRIGGGRDGVREAGFGTAGISLLSTVGAVDVGGRFDLTGPEKGVIFGISGRLFVPTP